MKIKKLSAIAFLLPCLASAASFDTSFQFPEYRLSGTAASWSGQRPQTIFTCYALNGAQKERLRGLEFSFRKNDAESRSGACRNHVVQSFLAISGKDLKIVREIDSQAGVQYVLAEHKDYPIEFVTYNNLGDTAKLGWYRSNSKSGFDSLEKGFFSFHKHGFFSEGVFGPPLEDMPIDSSAVYTGSVSDPSVIDGAPSRLRNIQIAKVDFKKGEINFNAEFVGSNGSTVRIYNNVPIKFMADTGWFKGKIIVNKGYVGEAVITGFIGGKNGDVIYAMYGSGDAWANEGVDFMLGIKR